MKALKFTLIIAVVFATFTSCTKQDLSEDDLLTDSNTTIKAPATGGQVGD